MVSRREQLLHQRSVPAVRLDEAIGRVVVVGLLDRAVLREVVDPDHLVAPLEQLFDHIAANETCRPAHQNCCHFFFSPEVCIVELLNAQLRPKGEPVPAQVSRTAI